MDAEELGLPSLWGGVSSAHPHSWLVTANLLASDTLWCISLNVQGGMHFGLWVLIIRSMASPSSRANRVITLSAAMKVAPLPF